MSEFAGGNANRQFLPELPDIAGTFGKSFPTLDQSLDSYMDRNFPSIIDEWGLLREDDIIELERRTDRISAEVTRLVSEKNDILARADRLDALVSNLERRRKR